MKSIGARNVRRFCISCAAWLLAAASGAFATPARADSTASAAAQALFDQARALMAAGRVAEACPKFEESQRLDPGSGTLINLALCYERSGRTASAWSTYEEAAAAARTSGNGLRERSARERASALIPRLVRLVIQVPEPASAELVVTRDGGVLGQAQWGSPVPVDAGVHEIEARQPGYQSWRTSITVKGEGTTTVVSVPRLERLVVPVAAPVPRLESAAPSGARVSEPTAPPQNRGLGTQRIAALSVAGVGVTGLVVGSIFGLSALSKKNEADKTCSGTACTSDTGVEAGNDAHRAGNVATASMLVGAAALAGGVALWFTAPSTKTLVGVAPGVVTLRGTF